MPYQHPMEDWTQSEAYPSSRAGLPGKDKGHFCVAPLDHALPSGA